MKLNNLLGDSPMMVILVLTGILIILFQLQRKGYIKTNPWYKKNKHWVLITLLIGAGIMVSFDGKWVMCVPISLAGLAVWWQHHK